MKNSVVSENVLYTHEMGQLVHNDGTFLFFTRLWWEWGQKTKVRYKEKTVFSCMRKKKATFQSRSFSVLALLQNPKVIQHFASIPSTTTEKAQHPT